MFTVRDHYTDELVAEDPEWKVVVDKSFEADTTTIIEYRFNEVLDDWDAIDWTFDGAKWFNERGEVRYEVH